MNTLPVIRRWAAHIFATQEKRKLVVEHVRYVKQQAIDPVSKAISMAKAMGRDDLVERLGG